MIAPWNFALCVPTWKIAAALLVGEGVVFEPGLQTAGTGPRARGGAVHRRPARGCAQTSYRPTVVTGLQSPRALVRDELCGSVTAILPADGEDEALHIADATECALAASIFALDLRHALLSSRALRASVVFTNAATVDADGNLLLRGMGPSGNGSRDNSLQARTTYTQWETTDLAPANTQRAGSEPLTP